MAKTILMIDDDPDFQSAVKTILTKARYECIQAYSMRQGLKMVSEENPDLIILDVMMEDISAGFRFLKERMKVENMNAEAHIPILMLSSIQKLTNLNFQERMKPYFSSIDNFLDKPVNPKILLKTVKVMIKKSNNKF